VPVPPAPAPAYAEAEAVDLRRAVHLELEIWSIPAGGAASLLDGAEGRAFHFLEGAAADEIKTALRRRKDVELLQGPRMIVPDRELAAFEAGIRGEIRPVVSEDGEHVTLDVVLGHPDVEGALRTTIILPGSGQVAMTGFPLDGDSPRELLVLLRADIQKSPLPEPIDPREMFFREAGIEGRVINIEARILEVAPETLKRVAGTAVLVEDHGARVLRAEQVLALLGKDRTGAEGVKILTAPRLTTYDGQKANISMLNQTSYVQDYDVGKAPDGSTVADPIIGVIAEGLTLEFQAKIRKDGTGIDFESTTSWADIVRPIPTFETELAGTKVTIQLPEIRVSDARHAFRLPPGAYALLGAMAAGPAEVAQLDGAKNVRCVLLRATVIKVEDLLEKEDE
jgi:hypothetical protein